jgi:hypothetical protein
MLRTTGVRYQWSVVDVAERKGSKVVSILRDAAMHQTFRTAIPE